jgi:hypothetical protein
MPTITAMSRRYNDSFLSFIPEIMKTFFVYQHRYVDKGSRMPRREASLPPALHFVLPHLGNVIGSEVIVLPER